MVDEMTEQELAMMAGAEWQGQSRSSSSYHHEDNDYVGNNKGNVDVTTREHANPTVDDKLQHQHQHVTGVDQDDLQEGEGLREITGLSFNESNDEYFTPIATSSSSSTSRGFEPFRAIFGDKFSIQTDGATTCPSGHSLRAKDVVQGFSPVDEDDYTTRCPQCEGTPSSSSRFVSSFIVSGLSADTRLNQNDKEDEEGTTSSSSSPTTVLPTTVLRVMRLPAQALLKEVLVSLELTEASLSSATDLITEGLSRQLVLKMKDEGGPFPSPLFWNLMVMFEEMKLPSGFMVWLIRS